MATSINEDLTPLRKIYSDLDKKFPKYNHKKISDVNKAVKFLKSKLKPGSQLPIMITSFYNDYRGGEDITKNHKRFFQYTKKMLKKESVEEGFGGELKGKDKEKFEKARKENAEVLGYKLTGKKDIKETKKRDYKAEYKKFQSSTKSKKYRAELNKYNRKRGTYGNGDGKDASHKGGKIAGFEKESTNRGRAEKSRLKKESSVNEAIEPSGIMAKINKIVQSKQAAKIDGVLLDMFSANIMMRIFNAVNDKSKKDMNKGTMRQVKVILHKVMKQNKVRESVNEAPLAFSSSEAKQQLDRDIGSMSKILGKASQQIIKIMMDGVKGGKYDAMDISRGIETGPLNRTHEGERPFMKMLWGKVRDGFRRYSSKGKLRK